MQFTLSTLLAAVALTSTTALAQPGGAFVAVGNQYHGGGCTDQSLTFADPIFGSGNTCQPLDRQGTNPSIVSYKTLSVTPGCTVKLYLGPNCSGTEFIAPVGNCTQGNTPFVSTNVTCV